MLAGSRADVDDVIGDPDRLLVVLHDQDRVPDVAQSEEGLDKLAIVPLVQTHGGLVEHIEDADKPAADLRREADSLGLTAGERRGSAVEAQVVEPDIDEELQPGADLLHHLSRDHLLPRAQREALEQVVRGPDRQRRQLGDAPAPDLDRKRLRAKPRPAAVRARHLAHVTLDLLAHPLGVRVAVAALQPRHDAFELCVVAAQGAVPVAVLDMHSPRAGAVEEDLALWLGELGPRLVHAEAACLGHGLEHP